MTSMWQTRRTSDSGRAPARLLVACVLALALVGLAACSRSDDSMLSSSTGADVAPVIGIQPSDVSVTVGGRARLSVGAVGTGLSYQWQRSLDRGTTWLDVPGATSSELDLGTPTLADDGQLWRVIVSRGSARTVSSPVTLRVSAAVVAPTIAIAPASQRVLDGATVSFSVTASGTALAYAWQTSRDGQAWSAVAEASGATLTLAGVTRDRDGERLRVVVSNTAGTVVSDAAVLNVDPVPALPAFTRQPASQTVTAPAAARFEVEVRGDPAPTLQWQRSTDGGSTWINLAGATGRTHDTPATATTDDGQRFRVVASNSVGTVTSDAVRLSVTPSLVAPAITAQPQSVAVAAGSSASFVVTATGSPTPAYQWQLGNGSGFDNIVGATDARWTFTPTLADNGRQVRVVVSNSQGTVLSSAVTLTVTLPPGPLDGKQWTAGLSVESLSGTELTVPLLDFGDYAALDDSGRLVLAAKVIDLGSGQERIQAVVARAGTTAAPAVTLPRQTLASGSSTDPAPLTFPEAGTGPDGELLVRWYRARACTTDPSGSCREAPAAARLAQGASTWQAVPGGFSDDEWTLLTGRTRIFGLTVSSGVRGAGGDLVIAPLLSQRLIYRASGQTAVASLEMPPVADINAWQPLLLDADGRFIAVNLGAGVGDANVHVARGSLRTGAVGSAEVVDMRAAPARVVASAGNGRGQGTVLWRQSNGTRDSLHAATFRSATAPAQVVDLGRPPPASGGALQVTVTDNGDTHVYDIEQCVLFSHVEGNWRAAVALPGALCASVGSAGTGASQSTWRLARSGALLVLNRRDGSWMGYDALRQRETSPFPTFPTGPGYLVGIGWPSDSFGGQLLLNEAGVGAYVGINRFSTLPSPALPLGDSPGAALRFGWALFLR